MRYTDMNYCMTVTPLADAHRSGEKTVLSACPQCYCGDDHVTVTPLADAHRNRPKIILSAYPQHYCGDDHITNTYSTSRCTY
jgi:hypothetical protein